MSEQFYDERIEKLPRGQLQGLQEDRLRTLVAELGDNRFYQDKFRAADLTPASLQSIDDLRKLAYTTKDELVAEQRNTPPFGRLLSYPVADYPYFHRTSGTSGRPLIWLDTLDSWYWWARCWEYVYRGCGVSEEDIVFFAFSFGPYVSHWAANEGARQMGAMAISGAGMSTEHRLQELIENNCTVLICTPTYALRLAEVAADRDVNIRDSAVRVSIHAGEPGASLPNVRSAIDAAWGATCYDHAGATEVGGWGFSCSHREAGVHLNEAEFFFEVINPKSGEFLAEGERGELVITTLGRAGMPVLRYRTGDLVELTTEPCQCGRSFARIKGGVLGRSDDMIIVRGVNLYPSVIDDLVRAHTEIVEYEVNIRRVKGMDDLLIKLETAAEFESVATSLQNAFRESFNIGITLEHAAAESLPRYEFKARRYKRVE